MATFRVSQIRMTSSRSWIAAAACCATLGNATAVAEPVAAPPNPSDSQLHTAEQEVAESSGDVARLATTVSEKEAELIRLENEMGGLREAVNKAMVDLDNARAEAERARQDVAQARAELDSTQAAIEKAQETLNEISRSAYRQGATNGAIAGAAGKTNTEDSLARQTYLRQNAAKQREAIEELDRLRTEAANKESNLREKREIAEEKEATATAAEQAASQALETNTAALNERTAEHQRLISERDTAKARLAAAKATSGELQQQRQEYLDFQRAEQERIAAEKAAAEAAAAKAKAEEEARAKAKAEAEARARAEAAEAAERAEAQRLAEEAAAAAAQAEAEAQEQREEQERSEKLEEAAKVAAGAAAAALIAAEAAEREQAAEPAETATPHVTVEPEAPAAPTESEATATTTAVTETPVSETTQPAPTTSETAGPEDTIFDLDDFLDINEDLLGNGAPAPGVDKAPELEKATGSRAEQIETVIARAQSQVGTPYAWGGGNANGPTKGIRDGGVADSFGDFNKVGFDCSGLVLYAFAGVGISLPHYTGYQYNHGTKVATSEMQRGDLIFYGPSAEHHVAIYLGDGMMIEAPQSGSTVSVNPVRWTDMSPYAVRLI